MKDVKKLQVVKVVVGLKGEKQKQNQRKNINVVNNNIYQMIVTMKYQQKKLPL